MEFYDQLFDQTTGAPDQWAHQAFEKCVFRNLNLSKAVLANANFINCRFENCNLWLVVLAGAKLNEVDFVNCTLVSVDFEHCSTFGFFVSFQECQLDQSHFFGRNLKKTRFMDCSIKEARFINCDLTGAVFKHANLELAVFINNTLIQADFSTAYNITLDPEKNKMKKARFPLDELPGLLTKYELVVK